MTTKRTLTAKEAARLLPPLPDPPKLDMQQFQHLVMTGVPTTLGQHYGALAPDSITLVSGNGYLCRRRSDLPSCPYPDLVIAFDVDQDSIVTTNGYVIEEAGKPPDFVLEVASKSTGRRDYIEKRVLYANLDVREYWRFDHTGGDYHDAPLACNLLMPGGDYEPMPLTTEPDGVVWGFSEALGLSVCWVAGRLRFWDRRQQQYLPDHREMTEARADAEERAASELQGRRDAEARVQELEEELRRLRGS